MKLVITMLRVYIVVGGINFLCPCLAEQDIQKNQRSIKSQRKRRHHGAKIDRSVPTQVPEMRPSHHETFTLLAKIYQDISGFGVNRHDELAVIKAGGEPLYGEITYRGWQTILDDLALTNQDVLYDLGCGVAKTVLQAFLTTPVKKAMGIELCKSRYLNAQKARTRLADAGYIPSNRVLAITFQDFVKADISDATVVYVLCLNSGLMLKVEKKLSRLKKGLRVITLKRFSDHQRYGFELVKEYKVPMSWMQSGSPVYLYRLVK